MRSTETLLDALCQLPTETEYVEFKENFSEFEKEGRDICALANSAAYHGVPAAYKVWGVEDSSHRVVGTTFNPKTKKKGNQELELWLRQHLSANAHFEFSSDTAYGLNIVVLKIWPAYHQPAQFDNIPYIRTGSSTQKLQSGSTREAELWRRIQRETYEDLAAEEDLTDEDVLNLLDYASYYALLDMPIPESTSTRIHYLEEDGLVRKQIDGLYTITNLGAILLAGDLERFPTAKRKMVRVIQYEGKGRISIVRSKTFKRGYAVEFESLYEYIMTLVTLGEPIEGARRTKSTLYPGIAIRELLANSLIHQDFLIAGAAPMVELFDNRIEITNPGSPLVEVERLVNDPPRSRNEKLAALMRRFNICEEAGSGWDKIIASCEANRLPAPRIETREDASMRVTLFRETDYKRLSPQERLDACYWHACYLYAMGEYMTNQSLRNRFGLKDSNSAQVSRLIKDAIEQKLVKAVNPDTSPRYMMYEPAWV